MSWLSSAQACQHMSVSREWLYYHLHEIPHVKVGGQLRFKQDELDAYMETGRRVGFGDTQPPAVVRPAGESDA